MLEIRRREFVARLIGHARRAFTAGLRFRSVAIPTTRRQSLRPDCDCYRSGDTTGCAMVSLPLAIKP